MMFYLLNDCFTIKNIYFLNQSYRRDMIGKLSIQTRIATSFRNDILCPLTILTCKLPFVYRRTLYVSNDYSTVRDVYFLCQSWSEQRLVGYGSKHSLHFFSDNASYTGITLKLQVIYTCMDILHIERLLYYQKHSVSGLEQHEKSDWRVMARETYRSFSDSSWYAYTASPYIHRYLVCNYA